MPDTTRQAYLAALQRSPVKARRVVIDVHRLCVASKADVGKAADEIQAALNDVPYLAVGEGYADHVRANARADICLSWGERIEGGWDALKAELKDAQRRISDQIKLIDENLTDLAMTREELVVARRDHLRAQDDLMHASRQWRAEEARLIRDIARLHGELEARNPVERREIEL